MDLVTLVSLLNASVLSVAILGCLMFIITPAYRGVCILLGLVILATLTNILEDLPISRELHLISPVFMLGYGPAFYLAAKRLIIGPVDYRSALHFLPMLLALPFTDHPQTIIALGTLWRMVYALLTLQLIIGFNRQLSMQRSDANEVSLTWLGWLVGVSTLFSALDLLRLNFQPELGAHLNMIGYATSLFIFLMVLFSLILILNHRRVGLETIASSIALPSTIITSASSGDDAKESAESAADYQPLFAILDNEVRTQNWYTHPRLTLNQLSDLSGLSTRDISRSINLVAQMPFNDYINQHRVEHIKRNLAGHTKDYKINLTDLALAAGFSSKATFNQAFKKATGMTPSEYRSVQQTQHVQNQDSDRLISRH